MLIDAHCHFNSLSKDKIHQVASACSENYWFIDSSIDKKSSQISLEISGKYDFIYSSLGFHPFSLEQYTSQDINDYQKMVSNNKKIIAIGEIGLDYKAKTSLRKQEETLKDFLQLAKKNNLAIVIHNRLELFEKREDLRILNILDSVVFNYPKVMFHCFSYSPDFLQEAIKRKVFISFSLNILRNNKNIIASLKQCPLNKLILETDSPYMRINNLPSSPLNISEVYSHVASVRSIKEEDLEDTVLSNINSLFFKEKGAE